MQASTLGAKKDETMRIDPDENPDLIEAVFSPQQNERPIKEREEDKREKPITQVKV